MKSLHLLLYSLLICTTPMTHLSAATPAEIAALTALYDATDGDNWTNNTNWKNGMDPCDVAAKWYGVTCDGSGNITKLILQSNGLNGSIPSAIGDLAHLTELSFSWNTLSGSIPVSLTNITGLRVLKIYANQVSGNLPPEIGNLVDLIEITLSYNQLDGTIPVELGNLILLNKLDLSNNQFTGTIPPELGNLSNLDYLGLTGNDLTGNIPPELGHLSNLTSLYMRDNQLSGRIPPELGNLSNLSYLNLGSNQLEGSIPFELANLSNLTSLFLNSNQLECFEPGMQSLCSSAKLTTLNVSSNPGMLNWEDFCSTGAGTCDDSYALIDLYNATDGDNWTNNTNWLNGMDPCDAAAKWFGVSCDGSGNVTSLQLALNGLNGSIPADVRNLVHIKYLYLYSNQLNGNIPVELSYLENLEVLNLGLNQLNGVIPPELGILINLHSLNLGQNQLSGSLPVELSLLSNLTYLNLNLNQLTGAIPSEFGDFSNLAEIYLFGNQLSGSIPDELGNLSGLTKLIASNNQLSGEIPARLGNLSDLTVLYLSNNQLSGEVPAELGYLSQLEYLYLSNNQLLCFEPGLETLCTNPNLIEADFSNNPGNLDWNAFCSAGAGTCDQVDALIALYYATDGDNWTNNTNWLNGMDPCDAGAQWYGVSCDGSGNIIALDLSNNALNGYIPSGLDKLFYLEELYLQNNQLSGCFPDSLGIFCSLTYDFTGNSQLPWEGDFASFCNSESQVGAPCDDGDPNTSNYVIDANCGCEPPIHPLEIWLNDHPTVAEAVTWNFDKENTLVLSYLQWPDTIKQQLHDKYDILVAGSYPDFPDPLPNMIADLDIYVATVLDQMVARDAFFSFLATSLYHEIYGSFNWSIQDYSLKSLQTLYNWDQYFTVANNSTTNYQREFVVIIGSTPSPPLYLQSNFIDAYNIVKDTDKLTYARILEYARDSLVHFSGAPTAQNAYLHWQYYGQPPMSRVIDGTRKLPEAPLRHYTMGCHGTVAFTKWLGLMVNIPVIYVNVGVGHRIAILPSIDSLFITHGDDPYSSSSKDPATLGRHLLVEKVHFDDFFVNGNSADLNNNVGRRVAEIAFNKMPVSYLGPYCNDFNNTGNTEEDNYLANNYAGLNWTFPAILMDSLHFWDRLHLKLKSLSEYDWCFSSYTEPINYEAHALTWDYLDNATLNPDTSIFKTDLSLPMIGKSATYLTEGDWVEMVLYNSMPETWLGLSTDAEPSLNEMDYAIQMKNNVVKVFENGQYVVTLQDTFMMSVNWLKIGIEDGVVKYSLNGFVRHQHPEMTPEQHYFVYFGAGERESEINNIYTSSTKKDTDQDGIDDDVDNCPYDYNPLQEDENENGVGDVCEEILLVSPIIYLQGAYDIELGLMSDNLRTLPEMPKDEPYADLGYTHIGGGGEETQQSVLDITGPDAIVDWVFLELRDKTDHTIVVATRSVLLQRDGDVVDVDGVSPVAFANLSPDDYYLVVKHRNHLGAMSATPVSLSGTTAVVDFTSDLNNVFGGANGIATLEDGKFGLFSGDFNRNGQVQNTDYAVMVLTLGIAGYVAGDFDLNGQVQNTDLQLNLVPNIGRGQPFGQ